MLNFKKPDMLSTTLPLIDIPQLDIPQLRSYMIEETASTPFVGISTIDSSILIQGQIYLSMQISAFGQSVTNLLNSFYRHGNQLKKIRIDLEIKESGSLAWVYEMLANVRDHRPQQDLEIVWYYDSASLDGLHEGQRISARTNIPITYIPRD